MKKIERIMVGVDLSDYSVMTLDYGVALARGFMAQMIIINVINARDIEAVRNASRYYPEKIDVDDYIKKAKDDRYNRVHALIKKHFPDDLTRMKIVVQVGVPFESILQSIESEGAELVVVGNKGKGNVMGTLFGANAEKVFRHSPVPVLSVRDSARFSRYR